MEISIVSGTYNRIKWLQRMVESVRNSIGVGVQYEIVLVDGGSTDGTQNWCKAQDDIVLIEQKKLLGAVKAFNAGAYAAKGRYVILANDDIEFIDKSILAALSFMQDNPLVGIGCFYQDRGNREFHVEEMPAIEDNKQISTYYGQVCIVQKWLGDQVGWWGDYLHTYGGDNELSCNVIELGYKIEPIPCTAIHDYVPMDGLREKNNVRVGNQHPDTTKWVAKWTRNGKVGPVIKDCPDNPQGLKRLTRVLYSPIYEPGHNIQKVTKRGLRDALARVCLVTELAYTDTTEADMLYTSCMHDPDIFLLQMHLGDTVGLVEKLRGQHPHSIFVNWNGDYHPENLYAKSYLQMLKLFDYVGVVTTEVASVYNKFNIKWFYWQIGYESVTDTSHIKRAAKHDILFMANGYSIERIELAKKLRSLKGIDVGIYGSWPTNILSNGNTLYNFAAGEALYKKCKIALGDSQWPNATGFVSNRLFQAMAAGAFMLHQYFDGMEELLGLVNGKHIVTWVSWEDMLEKVDYYLRKSDERAKIAAEGQKFVLNNHSFDKRVAELFARIGAK